MYIYCNYITQMEEIKKTVEALGIPEKYEYSISRFSHPKIDEKYGEMNLLTIKLKNPDGHPLLMIPGYSFNSFKTMLEKLFEAISSVENKYSVLYAVNWGETIKAITKDLGTGLPDAEKFVKQDEFREEIAYVLDKCIRSPELDLKNFTVLSKSAGGGVSFFLAGINPEIKTLLVCCPGSNSRGKAVADRKELVIKLAWNKDDNILPFEMYTEFMKQLESQGNNVKFFEYPTGEHELNPNFLRDVESV